MIPFYVLTSVVSSGDSESSIISITKTDGHLRNERIAIHEMEPKGLLPVISSGTRSDTAANEKCASTLPPLKLPATKMYHGTSSIGIAKGTDHHALPDNVWAHKLPFPEFVNPVTSSSCNW